MRYQGNKYPKSVTSGQPKIDSFTKEWKIIPLRKALEQIFRPISLAEEEEYQLVTVKRNRGGVVPREVLLGKQIKTQNQHILKSGDFLIARRQIIHGACEFVPEYLDNSIVSSEYDIFQTKPELLSEYLKFLIHTTYLQQTFFQSSIGVDIEKMVFKTNRWLKFPIALPPIAEQKKIAEILGMCDRQIELTEKLINSKNKLKRGLMQKLFSQEIRFKQDNNCLFSNWKTKKLGDLCSITTGKLDANAMVDNGQYRFYTCAKNYFYIDNYEFDTNALIISGNGANVGYIHHYEGKFNAYQRTYVLDEFFENIFYVKFFLDKFLKARIYKEKKEGNTPYIVMSTLAEMKILIPSLEEQNKIASLFLSCEKDIKKLELILETFKKQKKGLMQQLLTGKTRVNITP